MSEPAKHEYHDDPVAVAKSRAMIEAHYAGQKARDEAAIRARKEEWPNPLYDYGIAGPFICTALLMGGLMALALIGSLVWSIFI